MYYRTCLLSALRDDLTAAGFAVRVVALTVLGRYGNGNPRCLLILARKPADPD
jgi:hypothetical protein